MWQSRKNSPLAGLLLGLAAPAALAGIVLDNGLPPPGAVPLSAPMRSIILAPVGVTQSEAAYLIQRSQGWRVQRSSNPASGVLLVVPPALGGVGTPTSIRQQTVRSNLFRANAYRMDHFRR